MDRIGTMDYESVLKYQKDKIQYRYYLIRTVQELDHQIGELDRILYEMEVK